MPRHRYPRHLADHQYRPWTDDERAIAADTSLSGHEAAEQLGRTYGAVMSLRHSLRQRESASEPDPSP